LALVTPLAQQDKDSAAQSYFGDDAPVTGIPEFPPEFPAGLIRPQ